MVLNKCCSRALQVVRLRELAHTLRMLNPQTLKYLSKQDFVEEIGRDLDKVAGACAEAIDTLARTIEEKEETCPTSISKSDTTCRT